MTSHSALVKTSRNPLFATSKHKMGIKETWKMSRRRVNNSLHFPKMVTSRNRRAYVIYHSGCTQFCWPGKTFSTLNSQLSTTTMDPLSRLPQEVVLRLTSFASLSQLGALSGTSKAWSSFLSAHENVIYRRHAEVEVSDGEPKSLKMACSESDTPGNSFEGVKSWKEFCESGLFLSLPREDALYSLPSAQSLTLAKVGDRCCSRVTGNQNNRA